MLPKVLILEALLVVFKVTLPFENIAPAEALVSNTSPFALTVFAEEFVVKLTSSSDEILSALTPVVSQTPFVALISPKVPGFTI